MSTLELKLSKEEKNTHISVDSKNKKVKDQKSKKKSDVKSIEIKKQINIEPQKIKEINKNSNLITNMESNFESLHNKMNSMLQRANHKCFL